MRSPETAQLVNITSTHSAVDTQPVMARSLLEHGTENISPLEGVPDDVLANIARRLDLAELASLERVSKTLRYRVCHRPVLEIQSVE